MHYQQARLELNTVISDAHITDQTSQAECVLIFYLDLLQSSNDRMKDAHLNGCWLNKPEQKYLPKK